MAKDTKKPNEQKAEKDAAKARADFQKTFLADGIVQSIFASGEMTIQNYGAVGSQVAAHNYYEALAKASGQLLDEDRKIASADAFGRVAARAHMDANGNTVGEAHLKDYARKTTFEAIGELPVEYGLELCGLTADPSQISTKEKAMSMADYMKAEGKYSKALIANYSSSVVNAQMARGLEGLVVEGRELLQKELSTDANAKPKEDKKEEKK